MLIVLQYLYSNDVSLRDTAKALKSRCFAGKFFKAVNAIKKATLDEFASANSGVSLEKRLNDLRKFLKVATEGGSIDFARTTLGKSLFVFMKVSQVIYSYVLCHTIPVVCLS